MKKLLFVAMMAMLAIPLTTSGFDEELTAAHIKMNEFKDAHPNAKFMGSQYFDGEGFFEIDGTANYIFGEALATGSSAVESAQNFYNQIEGAYAEQIGQLVPGEVHGVMFDKTTKTHKFSACRFQQTIGGIPVYKSGIGFLIRNEQDFPVVMSSNNFKELQGFDVAASAFVLPRATAAMIKNTEKFLSRSAQFEGARPSGSVLEGANRAKAPVNVTDEELIVWAGVTNVRVQPELAISFMAERGTVADPGNYRRFLIVSSVATGKILYTQNQVHTLDVEGTVSGTATNNGATFVCAPESVFALPYAGVEILGGASGFADALGNFDLTAPDGSVTVRAELRGQFFEVFDQAAGGSTPFVDVNVNSPGTANPLLNDPASDLATANTNAYIHCNIVRDFVLSFEPSYPTIANQTFFDTNTNLNDDCNAFYNGLSTNYFTAGGGCNNTAFGDVVYHEYGHHLVGVTGNNQGQFGEGSGDTIGMLIEDDPVLGQGFSSCNAGIRSATNFRTYPCMDVFSPHDCGQLLSGSFWDLRNELGSVDPANAQDIASALFIGMLIVRGQTGGSSMIGPEIPLIVLELDDDDGNIGNGTPHYQQIADAFNPHNLQVPELDSVSFGFPNGLPAQLAPNGGTAFQVDIEDISSSQVLGSGTLFYDDGSGFVSIPMDVIDADSYNAVFPATTCGTMVRFYVSVEAQNGETVLSPADAPTNTNSAISAVSLEVPFLDTFDTFQGWTVTGNATDGQWQRGIPNNGDRGDPLADAEIDGSGFCFVTDNNNTPSDNSDVDNGSTTLTSPVMDASITDSEDAFISYFRWYSNDFGAAPFEDTFVIEISNNGGATWLNLETVGPTGPDVSGGWIFQQFQIDDIVEPTDNMRVRFTASDFGEGSVVEAGVDRVEIQVVNCDEVPDVLIGDVNMDGVINLLDVAPFVDLISNGGFQVEADINGDGEVNLLDVGPFVDLLSN